MKIPRLLIADGHLGIWAAVAEVFPEVAERRLRIPTIVDTDSDECGHLRVEG